MEPLSRIEVCQSQNDTQASETQRYGLVGYLISKRITGSVTVKMSWDQLGSPGSQGVYGREWSSRGGVSAETNVEFSPPEDGLRLNLSLSLLLSLLPQAAKPRLFTLLEGLSSCLYLVLLLVMEWEMMPASH